MRFFTLEFDSPPSQLIGGCEAQISERLLENTQVRRFLTAFEEQDKGGTEVNSQFSLALDGLGLRLVGIASH